MISSRDHFLSLGNPLLDPLLLSSIKNKKKNPFIQKKIALLNIYFNFNFTHKDRSIIFPFYCRFKDKDNLL